MEVYSYGKYLFNGYADASNHDTVTENPSGGYLSTWMGYKYYNESEYDSSYTLKIDDNGYPYVSGLLIDYTSIVNSSSTGFSINSKRGWLVSDVWTTDNCLIPNTVTIKCKLRFNTELMDNIANGEYYFLQFNSNLYGLYLNKKDDGWYFNNSVKIPLEMFDRYVDTKITLFFGGNNYNTSHAYNLRTLVEIDDITFYTFATSDNIEVFNILTAYSNDSFYITEIELKTYYYDSLDRNDIIIKSKPENVYPTCVAKIKLSNTKDSSILKYYELTNKTEKARQTVADNDSVTYVLNLIKETSYLKEKIIQNIGAFDKFPKCYLVILTDTDTVDEEKYNICDSSILELQESPNILYRYTDNNIYAVMLSDEMTEKYIRVNNYYAELVPVDDPNASHINVKIPNDIVRRLKKFPIPSDEIVILDCDFEDGEATDKTENYSFYDNSYGYDVNNNTWFSISDEMEFNDYHYDCNPDFSVPTLESGGSGESELINPYQVWILAEGWDNLWVEMDETSELFDEHNNSMGVIEYVGKLNKIGEYFILSVTGSFWGSNEFKQFHNALDPAERTKSTLVITSSNTPMDYYGKIIKITENSDTIEIIGDIYA